jgi:hypothetical protein
VSEAESGGIFVSYRRQESSYVAGRLYDRFVDHFGSSRVFMDVDTIEPGVDFAEAISHAVAFCDVLLAIIGPNWLMAVDKQGRRRLEDQNDIVRIEIESALARNVRVIPILVEDAPMPMQQDLPESLASLSRRNAFIVRHESFRYDIERLITSIEGVIGDRSRAQPEEAAEPESRREEKSIELERWALKPLVTEGTRQTFLLLSGRDAHEIAITFPLGRDDKIEVDGKLIAKETYISGKTYFLNEVSSQTGSDVTIKVVGHWKTVESITLNIGNQTLTYNHELETSLSTRRRFHITGPRILLRDEEVICWQWAWDLCRLQWTARCSRESSGSDLGRLRWDCVDQKFS